MRCPNCHDTRFTIGGYAPWRRLADGSLTRPALRLLKCLACGREWDEHETAAA